ncbi:MAG TPA: ferritin family protein [Deltaproteobacteria bacterium]|nr:ferritin family protein [Deltaproteobacteria bacterium]
MSLKLQPGRLVEVRRFHGELELDITLGYICQKGSKPMFTASELFDLAIQVEINGERFYRYALSRVKRDSLKNLLGWLADEELRHKSTFLEIKEKADDETTPSGTFFSLSQEVLRNAMGRHAFSLDELEIDLIQDEKEVLRAAIAFEEDAILFFEFITPFVSDPGPLSTLEHIKKEELNHKLLLTEKLSEF